MANKLYGEGMLYLYYRTSASNSGGIATRNNEICGIKYRQQQRYLKNLERLGWISFIENNKLKIKSIRAIRPELGLKSRQVVVIDDFAFESLEKFKIFCFAASAESVARTQNVVVNRRKSSRDKCGPEMNVFPSRNRMFTASEIERRGIGYYKDQLSLSLLSENLDLPKSTIQSLKKRAVNSKYIFVSTQKILLASKEDADTLSVLGYYPKCRNGQFYIRTSDEIHFRPRSIGRRWKNDIKPKVTTECFLPAATQHCDDLCISFSSLIDYNPIGFILDGNTPPTAYI
jgi:hypothetical protein